LDDCIIKFEIWDTAGQERYHSLAPLYYRNASLLFVVFDTTCYTSYIHAKNWITELKQSGPEKAIIVLVGNKVDITDLTKIKSEIVNEYASENNIKYIETSAKTNYNIEKLFKDAALSVPKKDNSTINNNNNTNNIKVDDNDNTSNSYCCYYI
jgi:Ras-related protein Rab-5C